MRIGVKQKQFKMKKPHNYYCHRTFSTKQTLPGGYEIIDKIGEGAFGQVYKVFNAQTSSIQVIKKIKQENSTDLIQRQTQILTEMENSDGFARVKSKQTQEGCLVMTFLGKNLQQIMDKQGIGIIDMKRIAYQIILRLKDLHDRGYVHRDIKPQNILMGNQNSPHKVYLVDFGLSSTFKKSSKVARKFYNGQVGTIKFCPLASHYGLQQFPKDDLQSLGYLLTYIAAKKLPWSSLKKQMNENQKYSEIKKMKEMTDIVKLSEGIGCLKRYFKAIKDLKVGQQIDYDSLLQIFKIDCKEIFCFSFCRENCLLKMKEELSDEISEQGKMQRELRNSRSNPFLMRK